jgi:hypothetical protein
MIESIILILFVASLLGLVIGLFEPSLVIRNKKEPTRKQVLLYYGSAVVILFLILPQRSNSPESDESTVIDKLRQEASEEISKLPDDLDYQIINKSSIPGSKLSFDIRLNRRVSQDVLRQLAYKLKNSDNGNYNRTFIGYLLPDMTVNEGYWATSHFEPELSIKILGTTLEEEKNLKASEDINGEIIGKWIYRGGISQSRLTLFRNNGQLFLKRTYEDGSSRTIEMIENKSTLGKRLERKDNNTGDYWLLNQNGNLKLRNDRGLIGTAKKIE